jgi:hypothetical protein
MMELKKNLSYSILCISLIFFFTWIIMGIEYIFAIRTNQVELFVVVLGLIGLISLFGSIFSLVEIKKISNFWYLGIPNSIGISAVFISSLLNINNSQSNYLFSSLSLAILPITSIMFFFSFPEDQRKITRIFAIPSFLIGIYSLIGINYQLKSIVYPLSSYPAISNGILTTYLLILMPVVGLLYIITSYYLRISNIK